MQVTIRHNPSNAVARCALEGGEVLKVQPDAMIAHSPGVVLTAGADGGVIKGLRRKMLGGESFFITTYTAPPEGGWVASSTTIALDSKWGGLKNLMGGEGGFIVRASGAGTIVLACFGALDIWDLAPGETFTLDTNHMVAYEETVSYKLHRAVEGRSIQSFKTGEGWVFEFTGPGRVYGQTRSPQSLLGWLQSAMTGTSSSPTGGGLGGLL